MTTFDEVLAPAPPSPWRQRPVLALVTVVFISSAAVWAAVPYLPLFLKQDATAIPLSLLGVVVASSSFGMLVGQYPMARLAARLSARGLMTNALVLEAMSLLAIVVLGRFDRPWVALPIIGLRFLSGVGRAGTAQATRAAVRHSSLPAQRAQVFGLVGAADIAGITLGAFLGGLVASAGVSWVFLAGALGCLLGLPLALSLKVGRGAAAVEAGDPADLSASVAAADGRGPSRGRLTPALLGLLAVTAATTVLIGAYTSVWGLYLLDRGAGTSGVGLLFALFTLPYLVAAPLFGGWATTARRRIGGALVGTAGAVLAVLAYPVLHVLWLIVAVELIAATFSAAAEPSIEALVSELSENEDEQSRIFGLTGTLSAAGSAGSAVVAGLLLPLGLGVPFLVAGGIAALLTVVAALALVGRRYVGSTVSD